MNKPTLVALLTAVVSQAAGCIAHTRDDGGGGGSGGGGGGGGSLATITAHWSLRNMLDGATTACPAGIDTVQLFALPVDAPGNALGEPAIDLFSCNGSTGASTDLAPDVYQVWIELRSHDLQTLYAQSLSQVLDVRDVDQGFSTDILNDGGYFQLAWNLTGKTTNRPVACSQVAGLDKLKAISTLVAGPTRAYDDDLVCEDHSTVTGGLLQGSYTITIDAMAGGASVGSAAMLTNKMVAGQNRVTDLGVINIPINGL